MKHSTKIVRPAVVLPLTIAALGTYIANAAIPPVPVPPQNPITEAKRVLGKMLFWDEQLSSSNVVSCGTCHVPATGGGDNRISRNPGDDNVLNTPDDILGSAGIIRSDALDNFERDPVFAFNPQITGRSAPTMINAAFAPNLFWDGRGTSQFTDPQTGNVLIPVGGALESQAAAPILNNVEMAHAGFAWGDVSAKLQRVVPLDLSTTLPPDVLAARNANPSYPALFNAAFGSSQITAARIAMAIATYQRTLISDQSPFDAFRAGNPNALNPQQTQGFQEFQNHNCNACHSIAGPNQDLFTDHTFRNLGLRPIAEDNGRQAITGNAADAGRFKVPSLRNVALKRTFMHNGQFQTLPQVLGFYAGPTQFPQNVDPARNAVRPLPPQDANLIVQFLGALTDPRVQNSTFPFDRPTLFVDRPGDRNVVLGGGVAGNGGIVPQIIVQAPALITNQEFRVGVANARGTSNARLGVSHTGPVNGRIVPEFFFPTIVTSADGTSTQHWPLSTEVAQPGETLFVQWFVTDASALGGTALSNVGQVRIFCGSGGCPCDDIDFNNDGSRFDPIDIDAYLSMFSEGPCVPATAACQDIDFNNDGSIFDPQDIDAFLSVYSEGPCIQ
ncbi:MAG: cytochrome c peroxidase [Phycisphaerales bacterium]